MKCHLTAPFAQRFQSDGTFTNVNGTALEGHDAFENRHRETIQSRPLLVLSHDRSEWSIAAFHNTAVQTAPIVH
jgi:hypothetical protein